MKRQNYRLKQNGSEGFVRAKKRFGQHFLNDDQIAETIVNSLHADADYVVEIGPGKGVLTKFLLKKFGERYHAIEIDRDLNAYLLEHFPALKGRLHNEDFLHSDLAKLFPAPANASSFDTSTSLSVTAFAQDDAPAGHGERSRTMGTIALIGNFPYNISTEIVFRVLDHREQVKEVVGMFQREVAKRVVAKHGSKDYGIISVLLPCWYDREYLFELPPDAFTPPPKVHSAVVRLTRNKATSIDCDEAIFKKVVKAAFNQRRKMLRNSLSQLLAAETLQDKLFEKRPERLSLEDFIAIAKMAGVISSVAKQ